MKKTEHFKIISHSRHVNTMISVMEIWYFLFALTMAKHLSNNGPRLQSLIFIQIKISVAIQLRQSGVNLEYNIHATMHSLLIYIDQIRFCSKSQSSKPGV